MHSKSITNKENAMPPGITRSASPVKLVRRSRPRVGVISTSATPLAAVGQTTQLGSPVARGSNAAACPRLSQLMAGEDECQPNHAGEEKAKMGGSQRMVDMFLSSRRRQITGSDETGAFL
ncbi:uncharacterized protein VDAG_02681 [Verticillium dahliae VdLs.17]|uniref:Uncharacterized protein n=1 Tax=Verticillium dahliae (strain VdLs.17 / ATCC MYA-4575 / FGSC 10137) TaxID=498257 RepID=G2WYJ9_VERDV|nr:uncharacterized protein VDAG_02681 [Verticillium dahliae VdLs.17]EGY21157.1 hypothetical protein VDAG_02681 [Verticillium dahliae VdLs.17]